MRVGLTWIVATNSAPEIIFLLVVHLLDYAHTCLANDIVKASVHSSFTMDTENT